MLFIRHSVLVTFLCLFVRPRNHCSVPIGLFRRRHAADGCRGERANADGGGAREGGRGGCQLCVRDDGRVSTLPVSLSVYILYMFVRGKRRLLFGLAYSQNETP